MLIHFNVLLIANVPLVDGSENHPSSMYSPMSDAFLMSNMYPNVVMPCVQYLPLPASSSYLYQSEINMPSVCPTSSSALLFDANSNVLGLPSLLCNQHFDKTGEIHAQNLELSSLAANTGEIHAQNLELSSLAANSSTSVIPNDPAPIVKTNSVNFSLIRTFVTQETEKLQHQRVKQ